MFGQNYTPDASGEMRGVGLGRQFRIAVPEKWISFNAVKLVMVRDEPGLWFRIDQIATEAEKRGLVMSVSFRATDKEDSAAATIVALWKLESDGSGAVPVFSEAYYTDGSLSQRPPERKAPSLPWVVHADGYTYLMPLVQEFVRPSDVSLVSLSALNTYTLARLMDAATADGKHPVLLPGIPPTPTASDPEPPNEIPSNLVISDLLSPWRWTLCPGYIDAVEHVILERETLTQAEKTRQIAALDEVIQSIDQLGVEEGLRAASAALHQAIEFPPPELSQHLRLIQDIGRRLTFAPESVLGNEAIVIPESRIRPHREPTLSELEARYQVFLPPTTKK
jgi:hypothetical protein